MKTMKSGITGIVTAVVGLAFAGSAGANVIWDGGGGDLDWHNALNWEDSDFVRRVPTSSDNISLSGADVVVSATGAAYSQFLSGSGGTITVANGGAITGGGGHSSFRYMNGFTIQDGGKLDANLRGVLRSHVTIDQGGEVIGGGSLTDPRTITVNGTWKPGESAWADGRPGFRYASGSLAFGATGTVQLSLFGDGSNRFIEITDGRTLNYSTAGTIELVTENDYEPEMGHSWALWAPRTAGSEPGEDFTLIPGDGSNIVLPGLASGLSLGLDDWATDGRVTVIPEPASVAMLGLGALLLFGSRRRRR